MTAKLRTLVVGLGKMGRGHALAYHHSDGFEIIGLVNRSPVQLPDELGAYKRLSSFEAGLALKPDVVAVCTYTDTHAEYAIAAMQAGAHVFVEKPLAPSLAEAERVAEVARLTGRVLVVGYILRHHPTWIRFIELAREVGPPFVMRISLNQQSSGHAWETHKKLLESTSPIVDSGVHYVDVMLQITDSRPVQVRGMGVRLSPEVAHAQVNYGQLQVLFEDGSVGWYEAGWGPMISKTAASVRDVMGPRGSVSIVTDERAAPYTRAASIRRHGAARGPDGGFIAADALTAMADEPDFQALCGREQEFLLDAIRHHRDLSGHVQDAIRSLAIVLASGRSMREGRAIDL